MERILQVPFVVSTVVWELRPGQWNLTVALKATFVLDGGSEETLAPQQDGSHDDVFWDQTPHASLYSPTDYAPYKPRADVMLVGSAFAPGGVAVDGLTARLTAGDMSKALRVVGEREWTRSAAGARASAAQPFARIPLRYERAAKGGENVVGAPAGDASRPPPNIEIEGPGDTPGFGPVSPAWRLYRGVVKPEAAAWIQKLRGAPGHDASTSGIATPSGRIGPAPSELDFGFFNAAPRDQQVERLFPGMPVVLESLHARNPHMLLRLPKLVPSVFRVDPITGASSEISMRCDTLWIDTDREVFVLSWRGVKTVGPSGEKGIGRIVHAAHAPGDRLSYDDVEQAATGGRRKPSDPRVPAVARAPINLAATAALSPSTPKAAALPFQSSPKKVEAEHVSHPSPKKAASEHRGTMAMPAFGGDPPPMAAPFPLAAAGAATPAEEIPGAPWTGAPAPAVPRADGDLLRTMVMSPLAASPRAAAPIVAPAIIAPPIIAPVIGPPAIIAPAIIAPAIVVQPPMMSAPAIVDQPSMATPQPPPVEVASLREPRPASVPPPASPSAPPPAAPLASPWREDPVAPTPAAAPRPAPAPQVAVKGGVYGDFTRKKR